MLVHETQDLTVVLVRAYLGNRRFPERKRSHNVRFAFEMNSTLIGDERSLPTMRLSTQSANQRFTQDGLLILVSCRLSFSCV